MKLKDLFSVPDDQRVSEKQMLRVLICTACSILLCMSCMVGSAWAWFTVSLESSGNAIVVGKFQPALTVVKQGGQAVEPNDGVYGLEAGTYEITVDAVDQEVAGYVTVRVTDGTAREDLVTQRVPYTTEGEPPATDTQLRFTITVDKACEMTTGIGWGIPADPKVKDGDTVSLTFLPAGGSQEQEEENQGQTQEEENQEQTQQEGNEPQPSQGE